MPPATGRHTLKPMNDTALTPQLALEELRAERVTLCPADLANKWGFGDGDMFEGILHLWAVGRERVAADGDDSGWPYLTSHGYLIAVIRDQLLPTLPEEISGHVIRVVGVHNPLRIDFDDPRAEAWESMLEELPDVTVSGEDLIAIADRTFPERPAGWLALHAAIVNQLMLPSVSYERLAELIDSVTATDDERLLAAELTPAALARRQPVSLDTGLTEAIADAIALARRAMR